MGICCSKPRLFPEQGIWANLLPGRVVYPEYLNSSENLEHKPWMYVYHLVDFELKYYKDVIKKLCKGVQNESSLYTCEDKRVRIILGHFESIEVFDAFNMFVNRKSRKEPYLKAYFTLEAPGILLLRYICDYTFTDAVIFGGELMKGVELYSSKFRRIVKEIKPEDFPIETQQNSYYLMEFYRERESRVDR
jgi:hypothetical protein